MGSIISVCGSRVWGGCNNFKSQKRKELYNTQKKKYFWPCMELNIGDQCLLMICFILKIHLLSHKVYIVLTEYTVDTIIVLYSKFIKGQ